MKVNVVAVRVWIFTIGFILFSFLATTLFYGLFYSRQVEERYLSDFNGVMQNVEALTLRDPHFLVHNIEEYDLLDSRVYFHIHPQLPSETSGEDVLMNFPASVQEELSEDPRVAELLEGNSADSVQATFQLDEAGTVPFVFRQFPFEYNGEPFTLYSYADLAFLSTIETRTGNILVWLIVVYLFLSFLYYMYLKRTISEPIKVMTDTAFAFAKNDYSREIPVKGQDDLAQLAMAMNKMGKALETSATAISQEKDLLSNVLYSIDTGVLYFDEDYTLLLSNPVGELFLQEYREYQEKFSTDSDEDIKKKMEEASTHATNVHYAVEVNESYYSINIFPIREEGTSNIRGCIVSIQDLTQEYRLDKTRVDFINNISHELRTPLVMVQGYSEAIIDDVAETMEEKKEMATIIREEAERMNRMVNDMLDLSRMEAGYVELSKEVIDLEEYYQRLVSRFQNMANENNIELSYEIKDDITHCYMDLDKMDQVFVNLINNALRHTRLMHPSGGKVTLAARWDELVDEIVLEVSDNGSGIPKEDLPYIFDRFYMADKSRVNVSASKRGTGIGLSLVRKIIEAHDGYVEAESDVGQGTTFFIHLPYEELEENG